MVIHCSSVPVCVSTGTLKYLSLWLWFIGIHTWMQPLWVRVHVCVCLCVRETLTNAGAKVSIFPVAPMVVGVTVVAAHRLQLDLLDLHGLRDGRVGSCCRRRCQTWGEEVEETWLLRLRPARTFQNTTLLNENKQGGISKRRWINAREVTTWHFIFWQPTLLQQVILLMGRIPVHGSIICFFMNVSPTLMLPASILMYLHLDLSRFGQYAKYERKLNILHRRSDAVWQQRVQGEERVREKLE